MRRLLTRVPPQGPIIEKSIRHELVSEASLPVAFAVMEGGVVGVIADKIFSVSPMMLALIMAAAMFSNLSSFLWARIVRGKPRVRFLVRVQAGILICTGLVGFLPVGELGAYGLVALVILMRLLVVGMITARSLVWSLNYGRTVRARITGRLTIVNSLTTVLAAGLGGLLLDADPEAFRLVFSLAALFGIIGVVAYSGITVVDEPLHLASEQEVVAGNANGMWQILVSDKRFAKYQVYQFLAGTSNMMLEAPLIYLVSNQLGASYSVSILLTVILPFSLSIITLPLWANYLDRTHVTHFRARQSNLWVFSQLVMFVGALYMSVLTLALGRVILGVARGGGSLAWNLGHNDFARPDQLAAYMGAHVTLTGIRGAVAPFMGIILYLGWDAGRWLPAFDGLGAGVFLLAAAFSGLSWLGYHSLGRQLLIEEEQ